MVDVTPLGVYFGYAQIPANRSGGSPPDTLDEGRNKVHPMVMSLGRNPFYKNEKLTAVCHSPTFHHIALITSLSCASEYRKSTSCISSTPTFTDRR